MHKPLRALIVEDSETDSALLVRYLVKAGYQLQHEIVTTGEAMRAALARAEWDVVLSDHSLPSFSGLEALSILRVRQLDVPFILLSGTIGEERAVEIMRAGAQDYVMKTNLHRLAPAIDREMQEAALRRQRLLEEALLQEKEQKLDKLRRFFSSSIAEHIVSGKIDPFSWHRRDVTVLFVDLRGFTNFVELSEPEEVMATLQEYYSEVGRLVQSAGGSIGHLAGDEIMVFFNDPIEVPDPQMLAVQVGVRMRSLLQKLCAGWEANGSRLNFGAGVASGFATIGGIGIEGCWDYTIIGTVANVASRLCHEAKDGQLLVSQRFWTPLKDRVVAEPVGSLTLKGIHQPVAAYNIVEVLDK